MKNHNDWIVLLLLPLLMLPTGKKMSSIKKSNLIGLVTLIVFVVALLCHTIYKGVVERQIINETENEVFNVASSFAKNEKDPIMSWAKGEMLDHWGNSFVLSKSSYADGVQITSKGPDGTLGTEDDIKSEIVAIKPRHPVFHQEESLWQKTKSKASKIKSFFVGD